MSEDDGQFCSPVFGVSSHIDSPHFGSINVRIDMNVSVFSVLWPNFMLEASVNLLSRSSRIVSISDSNLVIDLLCARSLQLINTPYVNWKVRSARL